MHTRNMQYSLLQVMQDIDAWTGTLSDSGLYPLTGGKQPVRRGLVPRFMFMHTCFFRPRRRLNQCPQQNITEKGAL